MQTRSGKIYTTTYYLENNITELKIIQHNNSRSSTRCLRSNKLSNEVSKFIENPVVTKMQTRTYLKSHFV